MLSYITLMIFLLDNIQLSYKVVSFPKDPLWPAGTLPSINGHCCHSLFLLGSSLSQYY